MTIERDNLNHMRTTMPRKNPTPTIDSGFSSTDILEDSREKPLSRLF